MSAPRVLLVSCPWRNPRDGDIGVSTLQAILRRDGIETDALYGATLFPRVDIHQHVLNQHSTYLFVPLLYPDIDRSALLDACHADLLRELNLHGILDPAGFTHHGVDAARLRREAEAGFAVAEQCLERCMEAILRHEYDVIGLSCTFESQLPAALAIAARLRREQPDTPIILGGAACFGELPQELLRLFPALDVVCHSEGDRVITPLVRALCDQEDLAGIPGIAFRRQDGEIQRNAAPRLLDDLDWLPPVDYDDFVAQLEVSDWADAPATLFFETSRGCWWGEKHLCSFCGINAEGIAFRRKSAERAYADLEALYRRYGQHGVRLHGTDNILDMSFYRTLLPQLAAMERDQGREPGFFFEMKSNVRREHIERLAAAGVDAVQPGIESLSDAILKLMDKGVDGLQQVQCLKWLAEFHIGASWNLIVGNPNEQPAHYEEMTAMVPYLVHLKPPGVVPMWLERFSPYHSRPEAHGIENIRPRSYYRWLYPQADAALDRLAYVFDFDHEMFDDAALRRAKAALALAVMDWQVIWEPDLLWAVQADGMIGVLDRRPRATLRGGIVGAAVRLWESIDRVRARTGLGRTVADLDPECVDAQLDTWNHRRWVLRGARERTISVVPNLRAGGGHNKALWAAIMGNSDPEGLTREVPGPQRAALATLSTLVGFESGGHSTAAAPVSP